MYYLVFEVSRELQEAALVVQALIQGQFPFSWFLNYICRVHTVRQCVKLFGFNSVWSAKNPIQFLAIIQEHFWNISAPVSQHLLPPLNLP